MNTPPSYKTLKEDFVSNHYGGSIAEINCVTIVAPAAYFLWSALQARQNVFVNYGPIELLADFLLNVGCLLLVTTIYSSNYVLLNVLLLSPACILYLLPRATRPSKRPAKPPLVDQADGASSNQQLDPLPVRPFITVYRGSMMIITCLAILAVDFRIFPRRFAKVETWGTSLMDMGVGSFVFSAGLVSARPVLKARLAGRTSSLASLLASSMRTSLPLLVLGAVRLYSVKGLDYAEHVTEYGVHWNFFFTLALLPPFVALCQPVCEVMPRSVLPLILGVLYQCIMEGTHLKVYILTALRTDLLSQNREGVFSFLGYLSVFLAGQAVGFDILPRNPIGTRASIATTKQRIHVLGRLTMAAVIWITTFLTTTSFNYGLGLQVSRRLANLPYVCWVAAFNCSQLLIFCIVETFIFPDVWSVTDQAVLKRESDKATSKVLKAFNRNGLAIFLLANLLTGLVNLTLDTLSMSHLGAMSVLLSYAGILTSVAIALDYWNISIKL